MIKQEQTQQDHDRAHRIFTEMLTSVGPETKDALIALYTLVRAEIELNRCSCVKD